MKPKILTFDVAVSTGWAFYDTGAHHADMVLGAFSTAPKKKLATRVADRNFMRRAMDREVCGLIDRFRPDCICIEQPLAQIISHRSKGPKKPLFKGDPLPDVEDGASGPNANAVLALNQLFAVVDTIAAHKCELVLEVAPKTWQTLTASFPGSTKERSVTFLHRLGIEFPMDITNKKQRHDAADAGVIAWWAAGHSQELKMLRNARDAGGARLAL